MASPIFLRCQACNRIVSARSRHCPRCKRWTGSGHGDPSLDRRLEAIRSFGVLTGLWSAAGAVAFFLAEAPVAAGTMAVLSMILICSHLLVPWYEVGWWAVEAAWALAIFLCAAGLVRTGWGLLLTLLPTLVLVLLRRSRGRFLARLRGEPTGERIAVRRSLPEAGRCQWCGRPGDGVAAPVYVVSVITFTARHPGRFRSLCVRCARIAAVPATVVTFVLGWWGIPWGVIWTPQALLDNVEHGGVSLDRQEVDAAHAEEAGRGSAGALGPAAFLAGLILVPLAMGFAILSHLDVLLPK